ncbi:hypothetical protein EVA_21670 [gut metagenome]|uniref:Uncharacterized protein n=1 Tax=gut metagenome TaxID=749906 RepID=J9F5S3_9ZZZZ
MILLVEISLAQAQTEENIEILTETKSFGGFLLDMTLMNLQPTPNFSDFKLEIPDASKDYTRIFRLNPDIKYTSSYGFWGLGNTPSMLQMSSFKLKNGMSIHTYGEYNAEGRKVPNPSALPWERKNFKGAFELKSPNGAFGFRLEVQQGY